MTAEQKRKFEDYLEGEFCAIESELEIFNPEHEAERRLFRRNARHTRRTIKDFLNQCYDAGVITGDDFDDFIVMMGCRYLELKTKYRAKVDDCLN